jgi:hypothetical protein
MFKVNVGLSRKLSRDYNSTGFSLNLERELCVGTDDPEVLIEKIKEVYDLAEEALNQQIERYEADSAIASRDEAPVPRNGQRHNGANRLPQTNAETEPRPKPETGNVHAPNGDAATNKQVQYLLNLGKRHGLTPPQLEGRIESILGKRIAVYDLTKKEAGDVIDALSQNGSPASSGNGRSRASR